MLPRGEATPFRSLTLAEWVPDPFASEEDEDAVVVGPNPLDLRKAECPYCHKTLPKVPGRKKKCLHCGGFMFVRTRPEDRARVVVTQAEADRIDCDWSIIAYAAEPDLSYLSSRQEVEGKPEGPGLPFRGTDHEESSDDDVK